ncbi:hypothetical protein NIAMH_4 [Serratia phage vB_SmaS_Niamh]|uniref:Uncharacterized protein n=1 Tax=Serratia phage vB_SmaS_Ulliraptor TaxID=2902694 RepID=A0AC61TNV0_9CAUD|nr:hypothetical protein QJS27_gp04 [Serratia phage vB_SmaS_Ulliraptor]QPX74420.1 hypothetical protein SERRATIANATOR_64 [Serratia phage vB_SmaS_Serratianator]UGO51996.1 hypothetical protein ULLIRAPTOR_4 [Serratia phage vB_SmaS_Ulliraptor]UGO52958.1 hypothetical protein NIAMH_4 [Serratia phage vB_SmaS_Niamh]
MINGSIPKLYVITLEGFVMMKIVKGEGFDVARALRLVTTVVEKKGSPKIHVSVSSSGVSIAQSHGIACTELTTEEAIKLFAGLLEDIKEAGNEK